MPTIKHDVFISYAREDEQIARTLFTDLLKEGINAWFDQEALLPGQNWKTEIRKAIRECSYFLALLSTRSVNKRGFVQKELKDALDVFEEMCDDQIYIVPIRIEECYPKDEKLHELHWVDIFPKYEYGYKKILAALNISSKNPGVEQPIYEDLYGHTQSFARAGPEIKITVIDPKGMSPPIECDAIIDTGAVMSCLPYLIVKRIGGIKCRTLSTKSIDGRTYPVRTYILDIMIGSQTLMNTEIIGAC